MIETLAWVIFYASLAYAFIGFVAFFVFVGYAIGGAMDS